MYRFTIHGTRGSMPVSGRAYLRYGGHTTCFSLRTPSGTLVIDAGTGIEAAGRAAGAPPDWTVMFTHFHLDHVMGLPVFAPLYQPRARVTLMADAGRFPGWRTALNRLVGPPFWPLSLDDCGARIRRRDLPASGRMTLYGVRLAWCPVHHPQNCLAYRLEAGGRVIVIATDYEMGVPEVDARFAAFCHGADVLVYDAQYTEREYPRHRGWGHGVWTHGVALARRHAIRRLLLTHHMPTRTDRGVAAMAARAARAFPGVRAACDGMSMAWG